MSVAGYVCGCCRCRCRCPLHLTFMQLARLGSALGCGFPARTLPPPLSPLPCDPPPFFCHPTLPSLCALPPHFPRCMQLLPSHTELLCAVCSIVRVHRWREQQRVDVCSEQCRLQTALPGHPLRRVRRRGVPPSGRVSRVPEHRLAPVLDVCHRHCGCCGSSRVPVQETGQLGGAECRRGTCARAFCPRCAPCSSSKPAPARCCHTNNALPRHPSRCFVLCFV